MAQALQGKLSVTQPDVVFVRAKQARKLHRGPARIVLTALGEIDAIVEQLIQCRSKAEFDELRQKKFSDYVNLSYIIANSFEINIAPEERAAAVEQAISNVRHFFEHEGIATLGTEATGEAVFCLDTLRRAYRQVRKIDILGEAPDGSKTADQELAAKFNFATIFTQLHLDCLRIILQEKKPQSQEIMDELIVGLRSSVMAYSYVRQGVELRRKQEPFLLDAVLDDEDRELLEESFSDYVESESRIDAE
jgi:hypothetical protein